MGKEGFFNGPLSLLVGVDVQACLCRDIGKRTPMVTIWTPVCLSVYLSACSVSFVVLSSFVFFCVLVCCWQHFAACWSSYEDQQEKSPGFFPHFICLVQSLSLSLTHTHTHFHSFYTNNHILFHSFLYKQSHFFFSLSLSIWKYFAPPLYTDFFSAHLTFIIIFLSAWNQETPLKLLYFKPFSSVGSSRMMELCLEH